MNRWRVGEDRGSKEMDGCPLIVVRKIKNKRKVRLSDYHSLETHIGGAPSMKSESILCLWYRKERYQIEGNDKMREETK
jgi:hypothetical protein